MIKNVLVLLCILMACILSATKLMHSIRWDISQNSLNTLSTDSKLLLQRLDEDLIITISSPDIAIINMFEEILERYKSFSQHIKVNFNTKSIHEQIEIKYKNHRQSFGIELSKISEQQISMFIQQVIQKTEHWIAFVTGHEEADPFAKDQFGLSEFSSLLKNSGMYLAELNLLQQQVIPANVDTLIIINPQTQFTAIEQDLLHNYIADGGNLWIFVEPESPIADFLKNEFGVAVQSGIVVDPNSLPLGSPHPALKLLTKYPGHPINKDIRSATVMPWSAGLQINIQNPRWQYDTFLQTNSEAWTYTGPETNELEVMRQYIGDSGQIDIGISLQNNSQRILLLGDSSFITNKYINMYANGSLVSNMLQWLEVKPTTPSYNTRTGIDFSYCPSTIDRFFYNYVWIFIVPLLLCFVGFCIRAR